MARPTIQNVIVLGASYAGAHAAEVLARDLPPTHRVVLIDRTSHFQHIYLWPRYGVTKGNELKGFIPRDQLLQVGPTLSEAECPREDASKSRGIIVHAEVVSITEDHVDLDRDLCEIPGLTEAEDLIEMSGRPGKVCCGGDACGMSGNGRRCRGTKIPYAYLVYALGSIMPRPLQSTARTKEKGAAFLRHQQEEIEQAQNILIVGLGALGIQYATDIKDLYPRKRVTAIHPHERVLTLFKPELHDTVIKRFDELGIDYILGDRVILPPQGKPGLAAEDVPMEHVGPTVTRTYGGKRIEADLRIFATGQRPNTALMKSFIPSTLNADGTVRVQRTMQVDHDAYPRIYSVGDCADQFGAIRAGHTGWNAAGIAAENIIKQIEAESCGKAAPPTLSLYSPTLPMVSDAVRSS